MRKEEKEAVRPVSPVAPEAPVGPYTPEAHLSSEVCYFCGQRLYVLERESAEGKFFHRSCFTCHDCSATLRQGGYTYDQSTGRFYCELHSEEMELGQQNLSTYTEGVSAETEQDVSSMKEGSDGGMNAKSVEKESEPSPALLKPALEERSSEPPPVPEQTHTHSPGKTLEPGDNMALKGFISGSPVPAPRGARASQPQSPPTPKPRKIHLTLSSGKPSQAPQTPARRREEEVLVEEEEEERSSESPGAQAENGSENGVDSASPGSKGRLRKLELSDEERSQLGSLSYSQDSDSETPASSSASSSSSKRVDRAREGAGDEEEGCWSRSGSTSHPREHNHRRCIRRKGEPSQQGGRVRSKFSPWNLSSPRLGRDQRLSVHVAGAGNYASGEENGDDDEDDFDMYPESIDFLEQQVPSDPVAAHKLELRNMRTLERKAKISEIQRFHRAQTIQRRLEEIEVTFKDLEVKGVELEQVLREEPDSADSDLIGQWIELVQDKNALISEESDLMVASRQLELEDKQSMLEMELRRYMEISDSEKTVEEREAEERVLAERLEVVDMRDSLVAFLEEKRLKELSEPQLSSSLLEARRHSSATQVHWE